MNRTLIVALLQQRLRSPARVLLVLAFFFFPLLLVAFARGIGLAPLHTAAAFAIFMGAGILGQDISSGTVQLLFARPVSRAEYVVSRWLGASLAASCLVLGQLALGTGLLALRGEVPAADGLALLAGEQLLVLCGTVSVLLLYSSLLPGVGDFLGVMMTAIFGLALRAGAGPLRAPWMDRAGVEVGRFVGPELSLAPFFGRGPVSWFEVVSYCSTVTLCVALAIVILNRRELSYATE